MATKNELRKLIGKNLKNFRIIEMTQVFYVNDDGIMSQSIGFFKDPTIAKVFSDSQKDADWCETEPALILTDGKIGFVIEEQKPVKLFNEEKETLDLIEKTIAKLSPTEQSLLGLGD